MEGNENCCKDEVILNQSSDGLQCTERMTNCKNAVCRIWAQDEDNNIRRGTGCFVKLAVKGVEVKGIITNNHVLPTIEATKGGEATFYFEGSTPGISIKLEPEKLFYTHEILDFSLIGCDADNIETTLCIAPLELSSIEGNIGDDVFIFQHPKGLSKKVSYQKISRVDPPFVFYNADTDVGSSGSPVFKQFQLLALHSKGCEFQYNKGTLFSEISSHLNNGLYTFPRSDSCHKIYGRKRESTNALGEHDSSKKAKRENGNPNSKSCSKKDPIAIPTEKEFQNLAKDLVTDGKRLGRELEIPNNDINKIYKDNINYEDIVEKAFAILLKWKELAGSEAKFGVLKKALTNIGLVATAEKHC